MPDDAFKLFGSSSLRTGSAAAEGFFSARSAHLIERRAHARGDLVELPSPTMLSICFASNAAEADAAHSIRIKKESFMPRL